MMRAADPTPAAGLPRANDDVATLTFDAALAALRDVVERLEAGGLPLEESVDCYERGVALHERCAALLEQAELRLRRLAETTGSGVAVAVPFEDEDDRG